MAPSVVLNDVAAAVESLRSLEATWCLPLSCLGAVRRSEAVENRVASHLPWSGPFNFLRLW
jgi:hypothetical protein